MEADIHILHLEDDPADAELTQVMILEADMSCRITLVKTKDEFETALCTEKIDIILSDYNLPMYDGLSALMHVLKNYTEIPFIFVSGVMGEEAAIKALTRGATDYVLKNNLSRLVPAIQRALKEAMDRREHRLAQEALQRSNEMLRAIIEAAPVAIIGLDLDGHIYSVWNPAAEKMLGWGANDVIGKKLPTRKEEFESFRELIQRGIGLDGEEVRWKRRDGTPADYIIYSSPLHDAKGHLSGNIAVLVDITEHKQTEESIRKLSQAVDQSPVSIIVTDLEGKIEFVNTNFTRVTGYTHDEVIGRNPNILKSGKTSAEEYNQLWKTISSGKVWRGEFHNRKKDGRLFWEHATISPVRNANNVITHYMAVKEDVTERKELEEQLRNSQKMEAIGLLAGGIAHDFNNMLNVIIGYAEMIKEYTVLDERSQMFIEGILTAGQRSAEITQQLLTFARKQTINPKVLDLNKTVRGMLNLLRRLIGEDIDLVWLPGADIWSVKMDGSQIDQILVNLCVNARDAITGVGRITIETENFNAEHFGHFDVFGDVTNESSSKEYVMLSVSDNGTGMDKPTVDKVFEPFFTTKTTGKGTGLGLSTVFGIVKQNAGFIKVLSKPGSGSTFKIFLPRYSVKAVNTEEDSHIDPEPKGTETVLLVEDDILVLNLVDQMLKNCGYTVITSLTPQEAIQNANRDLIEIDLLLTDLVMPGMTGRDLEKKLTVLFPKLNCLFMSGYKGSVIANQDIMDENVNFIKKPFSQRELAVKVRDVLGKQ